MSSAPGWHNNPDPEAIASGVGFKYLYERFTGRTARIGFGGIVGRSENRAMLRHLKVQMIPGDRIPTHPREILQRVFLDPLGITQVALAADLGVPVQRINELVRGKRGITPETAWLLSQALDTTPEFWVNMQASFDLARSRPRDPVRRIAEPS